MGCMFFILAWQAFTITDIKSITLPILALVLILFIMLLFFTYQKEHASTKNWLDQGFLVPVLVLFIVTRLAWVVFVPTLPFSDFSVYYRFARWFSQGQFPAITADLGLRTYAWGYPLFLSIFYHFLGTRINLARFINIGLGVGSLLALYWLGWKVGGKKIARSGALLFLLWPAQWMYTGVLASEHLGLMSLLIALNFLVADHSDSSVHSKDIILASLFITIAFITRSVLIVGLLAGLLIILITRQAIKLKLVQIIILLVAFSLGYGLYMGGLQLVYHATPASTPAYNLMVGVNYESTGTYNREDADRFTSYTSLKEANRFAYQVAVGRITSHPLDFIILMVRKISITWKDDFYGAYFSLNQVGQIPLLHWNGVLEYILAHIGLWNAISQLFHSFLLLCTSVGCFRLMQSRVSQSWLLLLLVILGITCVHSILETQARYHYVAEPLLMLIAGYGISYGFSGGDRIKALLCPKTPENLQVKSISKTCYSR
jgi:hypothetical protein